MIVKQAYPEVEGRRMRWQSIVEGIKWAFLFAGFLCGVINLAVGGLIILGAVIGMELSPRKKQPEKG